MKSSGIILMILGVVLTSCYLFPFVLSAFPIANSKMIMAAVGIAIFAVQIFKKQGNNDVDRSFVQLSLWALAISFISWLSTVLNNTHDYTFATYFISMWVWIGGGYTLVAYIRKIHNGITVEILINYLIAVCVVQCILAMIFDNNATASNWAQRTFTGEGYMGATGDKRISGIGCALDVAGLRFSAILIMTAFITVKTLVRNNRYLTITYISSMMIITVIGSMISRTTAVGAAIAIFYILCYVIFGGDKREKSSISSISLVLVFLTIGISSFLYKTNDSFKENIRFGFEGCFSLIENGEWQTNSNDILKNMVVWPDNAKTWIIGDGYIENPLDKNLDYYDPYYIGPSFHGYYMQTDIGYCRFIFYFGIIGLTTFCLYFFKVTDILVTRFPDYKWMFYLILAMNFIGWCKVSSDLFMVFAPFICISAQDEDNLLYSEC